MLNATAIEKSYQEGEQRLTVLKDLSLELPPKAKVGIAGASGAGKSTLLHILGGLETPTEGEVRFEGTSVYGLTEDQRAGWRNRHIGFVFQFYHLVAELNAAENVMLPSLIAGESFAEARRKAEKALERVGLAGRKETPAHRLSGGEQQRVAIARAAVMRPTWILADEPTGNLDARTAEEVLNYLLEVADETGGGLVLVSHDRHWMRWVEKVYTLSDGKLYHEA